LNNRPLDGSAEWEALWKKREKEGLVMENSEVTNSKSFKVFIKGSLVLIGLFFALSCIVTVLLFHFDKNYEISKELKSNNNPEISKSIDNNPEIGNNINIIKNINITNNFNIDICSLIKFLITPLIVLLIFILIIFSIFIYLMKSKDNKPKDDKSKDDFLNMQKKEKNLLVEHKIDKLSEAFNSIVRNIDSKTGNNEAIKVIQVISEKILEQFSEINLGEKETNSELKCNGDSFNKNDG